jgi:hypothetical protein
MPALRLVALPSYRLSVAEATEKAGGGLASASGDLWPLGGRCCGYFAVVSKEAASGM